MNWLERRNGTSAPVARKGKEVGFRDDLLGLVDDFFRDWSVGSPVGLRNYADQLTPSMNVAETDDAYTVEAELPGVDKKDICIELNDNVLTIKGEKKGFNEEKKDNYHRIERSHGSFMRNLSLPKDIDAERVTASMENGVLHLEVAKTKEAKDKKRSIVVK